MRTPSLPAIFFLVCLLAAFPSSALPLPNIDGLLAAISAQIAKAIPINTIPSALKPVVANPKAPLNPKHSVTVPRKRSDLSEDGTRRRVLFAREVPNPKVTTTKPLPPQRTTITVTSTTILNAPTFVPIKVVNPKYPGNPKFDPTYIAKPIYTQTTTHPGEPLTQTRTVVLTSTFGVKAR